MDHTLRESVLGHAASITQMTHNVTHVWRGQHFVRGLRSPCLAPCGHQDRHTAEEVVLGLGTRATVYES